MAQTQPPTFINLPPPGSRPETPSEMPGTPTSTTTSLSALSTTAIKDGHRGHFPQGPLSRGHQHNPSTQSLEAERADRISRLAGLERVSTLRAPPQANAPGASSASPQTTPTSTTGFPPNYPASQHLTPAYFDSNGQPVAVTKMSTVGTASATESHVGDGDDVRTTAGEHEEDMLSTDTNYREGESVTSMGGYQDAMDEDLDGTTARSVGGYDDRMSDDGSASLVGFGEGAGSTVSGPIYQRRNAPQAWGLERTNSGLSDARRDRDIHMGGGDTPVSVSALQERRDARMMDGVATDSSPGQAPENDSFVDTTFRGPVSVSQSQAQTTAAAQEAAERIVQRLDRGETRAPASGLVGPGRGDEPLGKFYFEGEKRED
ncbi:hypothetical protein BKA59DRAFT_59376 [Fusarium tricinctum]|uniref:Uncharacterized protein n=1 Tax=Fusarium tricinctum TaxID=61284 RepID=A0A8K0SER6_9HYPO|nr:hypothetical protein BKA59DRAFT_59376 [Fusarium tricinctum]